MDVGRVVKLGSRTERQLDFIEDEKESIDDFIIVYTKKDDNSLYYAWSETRYTQLIGLLHTAIQEILDRMRV